MWKVEQQIIILCIHFTKSKATYFPHTYSFHTRVYSLYMACYVYLKELALKT